MKEKILGLEVTQEILEEVKEWNHMKSKEILELKGQIEELKGMKAKAEVEEEVANLKSELKALRADVKTKAMKVWPVNPFVPTALSLSSRVVFFHEVSLVLPSADLSISIPNSVGRTYWHHRDQDLLDAPA